MNQKLLRDARMTAQKLATKLKAIEEAHALADQATVTEAVASIHYANSTMLQAQSNLESAAAGSGTGGD